MPHIYPASLTQPSENATNMLNLAAASLHQKSRSQKALSAAPRTELPIGWGDEPPTHGECAEMMAAVEEILAPEEAKWSAVAATRAAEGGVGSRGNGNGTSLKSQPPTPSPLPCPLLH